MNIFETFKSLGQNLSLFLCKFWNDESIPLQILYPTYVSWKITPLYFFSSKNIYFSQKEPIKMKIFQISSAQVKFCQIPYVNLQPWVNSSTNLVSFCSFMKDNPSLLV